MLIRDKLVRGGVFGAVAGIIMEVLNSPLVALDYLKISPIDFSYLVVTHRQAETFLQIAAGLINHLLFASISGIILLYILEFTNYQLPIVKGFGIGLGTNIILLVMASFFDVQKVINISPVNILLLDMSAALFYGVVLGCLLNYFHQRFDVGS